MKIVKTIGVNLGKRSYDVTVGVDLLSGVGQRVAALGRYSSAAIVTDSHVGPLYADTLRQSLSAAHLAAHVLEFPAGEEHKNLSTYVDLVNRLLGLRPAIDRRSLIVSLGGGVASDLGGFVAATALRGLDFVNVPTTLLADVDASVGGKTGVDMAAGKNLVGTFHQPKAVVIDSALLASLPQAELISGLGECVKHAVIRDESLLDFLSAQAGKILLADADVLAELIARNVAIKAAVVSADEREAGERALLNLGHTLGHAVETAAGYGAISHGQAVCLGMAAACHISAGRKLLTAQQVRRVTDVLAQLHLPSRFADLPSLPEQARQAEHLKPILLHDKKALAGVVRFVLPVALGKAAVFSDVTGSEIDAALAMLAR